MKQIQVIYINNKHSIDLILDEFAYPMSLDGFIKGIQEKGNLLLLRVFNSINSNWDNANGKGWQKFKNIFSSITGVVSKVNTGANIANNFINPVKDEPIPEAVPEKKPWKPNMYLWGGIGLLLIVILLIVFYFKNKS